MKFRKKPIVVEAYHWPEIPPLRMPIWVSNAMGTGVIRTETKDNAPPFFIETLEGVAAFYPGDWIIKGVSGELYPVKPDIFEKTYEAVEDDSP